MDPATIDLLRDIASGIVFAIGGTFLLIGAFGLIRLPDFFSRTHAVGITDTAGAGLILIGLALHAPDWSVAVRLLLILLFLLFAAPTASHALAQAALNDGLRPQLGGPRK